MYRITRTVLRGQFANDSCFVTWLAAQGGNVFFVKSAEDPLNNGGPNDRRYYLWNQLAQVMTPKCSGSDPELIVNAGANGWVTQALAESVLAYELGQSKQIADQVAAANAAAVSPANIAAGVAADIKKDAASIVKSPYSWLGLAAVGAGVVLAVKVLK